MKEQHFESSLSWIKKDSLLSNGVKLLRNYTDISGDTDTWTKSRCASL